MFKNEDEFEKLIKRVKIDYLSNDAHELELRKLSLEAFAKSRPTMLEIRLKNIWEAIMNSKVTRYAAVIIILLVASYTIGILNEGPRAEVRTDTVAGTNDGGAGGKDIAPEFTKKFNEIKSLYAANDIKALLGLLESDDMALRLIAAEFLGQSSNVGAAEILENLSGKQGSLTLAEKFREAAANIRKNTESQKHGGGIGDKGKSGGDEDANGVSLIGPGPEDGFFLIKVIDKETKRPINNLNICAQIDGETEYYKTEKDWFCKVKLTKPEFGYFSVGVQADGYAFVRFVKDIDNPDYVVPLEYTIEMEKGVYIGGYVENKNGERLTSCKVKIKCERKNTAIDRAYADTEAYVDANGLWKCNMVPAKFDYLKLTGDHSDYVGIENSIESGREDHKLASELKYVVKVEKGIMVGGVVKNEEGEPVGGAKVEIICYRADEKDDNSYHKIFDGSIVADGKGNWQFGQIPDEKFEQIEVKVSHNDYVQSKDWIQVASAEFKLLEAKKFNTVIKRGKVISGVVRDIRGRAIADATVMFGASRYNDDFVKIQTDSAGMFLNNKVKVNQYDMAYIQPGQVTVTVVKAGYAPEMMVVSPSDEKEQLDFSLEGGYTISGRVVDVNGKGVEGVSLTANEWRNFRTIEWKSKTDSEGRFRWDDGPSDEVKFGFYKNGYCSSRDDVLVSSEEEHMIILYPPLKISGKVRDAQTGEAVNNFDITNGIDWLNGNSDIYFEKRTKKHVSDPNGKYEVEITNDYPSHLLKVEAEGYTTAVSKMFKTEEMVVSYDFVLTKAEPLDIVVKLSDGSIAENARLVVAVAGGQVFFQDGFCQDYNGDAIVMSTDADGRFCFSAQPKNFSLVITHDDGFLIVPGEELASLKEIVLQKWGTIQGYVYKGDSLVAEQAISVYWNQMNNSNDNISPEIHYSLSAVTDANGFFEVKKVIPAARVQCNWMKKDGQITRHLTTESVKVLPGGISEVELSIDGRPITGRLIIGDEIRGKWSSQMSYLNISSISNNMQEFYKEVWLKYYPKDYDDMTVRQQIQWTEDFQKTEQCRKYQEEIQEKSQGNRLKNIQVIIENDGNLKADGVASGRWKLSGRLVSQTVKNNRYEPLAKVEIEFEVPESEQLYCDEAFDLGEIKVKYLDDELVKLAVGDRCPAFEAETADGEKEKLEDFKGKYIVLNVIGYASWDQGHAELLNDIYAQYKADDVAMLTVTNYYSFMQIKKLEEDIKVYWPMAYIRQDKFESDPSKKFDIVKSFGCSESGDGWFVIGPEGEVLKAYIEFDELRDVLEEIFVGP